LPDFSQRFFIECDACGTGIGAILIQQGQPIAFFSEALKGSSLALSTYEKEMLAIVKAIRKWRPYLLGRPFTVRTDHKSLKFLLEQRITTPAQTRWLPKLLGYDYVVEYKKGPDNKGADALSRKVEFNFMAVSLPQPDWWIRLQQEVQQDSFYTDKRWCVVQRWKGIFKSLFSINSFSFGRSSLFSYWGPLWLPQNSSENPRYLLLAKIATTCQRFSPAL
jgi:hypothetical protein